MMNLVKLYRTALIHVPTRPCSEHVTFYHTIYINYHYAVRARAHSDSYAPCVDYFIGSVH